MTCSLVVGSEDNLRPKPGIINAQMIRETISQMLKDDVTANNIDEDEGYDLEEVKHIYLEHLDIIKMDHLWVMPNLTVLKLTGNRIEKIENIEMLVELVDLNLSFNKISVIENLNKLTKLRHLSLYSNLITKIQNLDHLKNLRIFTIGENNVKDETCVLHLRSLQLFSLNLAGNPCAKDENFRFRVAAYIPSLQYYEYKNVTDDERRFGREIYLRDLEILEREEATAAQKAEVATATSVKEQLHLQAFVQGMDGDQLCDAMMAADPSGEALLLIDDDDISEIYDKFKEEIGKATTEIFNLGIQQLEIRKQEVEMFDKSIQAAIKHSREKQRKIIEKFIETKSDTFLELNELFSIANPMGDEEARKSIVNEVAKTTSHFQSIKRELLNLELILSEQIKEVFSIFERSLGDMVNSFIETTQGFFTTMREHEAVFSEQLGDQASRFLTQLTVRNEDLTSLPLPLRSILYDKESLNQAVAGSHDAHLQVIDSREDVLINGIRAWYQKLCQDYEEQETARFRGRISEIASFMELQAQDLRGYSDTMEDPTYDVTTEGL